VSKMRVMDGCTLHYPDGSVRGGAGYVVALDARHENHALFGQMAVLEDCPDFFSSDAVDIQRLRAPYASEPSPAASKKKKKAKKKRKKS